MVWRVNVGRGGSLNGSIVRVSDREGGDEMRGRRKELL